MDLESASAGVTLVAAAEGADKGLLASMHILVRLQVAFRDEAVVADFACKGPFASVRPHVGLQVAGFGELLEAALIGAKQNFGLVFWASNFLDKLYMVSRRGAYGNWLAGRKIPGSKECLWVHVPGLRIG